jgi:uncharacterized membrane protein
VACVAHISDQIRIGRPVEVVFDFIADSRNEPTYNSDMRSVTLLTEEPIGTGSQFRAMMGRGGMEMLVTLTAFDRPHLLGSVTTSTLMDTEGTLTFTPDGDQATVMVWDWQVTPRLWLRILGPVLGPVGARLERRIWAAARDALQGSDAPAGS